MYSNHKAGRWEYHLPIQASVVLTCRLLTSISTLPTGAARPRAVLKTVIVFVALYGSMP